MQLFRRTLALLFSANLIAVLAFASHVHRSPTAGRASSATTTRAAHRTAGAFHGTTHSKLTKKPVARLHGQQVIAPERAEQIQQALIRAHYLDGEANGVWDENSVAAMQKFQGDQGWQTKLTPDPRALIKLGLGPDYSSAINANRSSFAPQLSAPSGASASSMAPRGTEGFAAAAGVTQ
jgi:peptidoglycan hydrolase-like protein with peptidoglycan-binding domain